MKRQAGTINMKRTNNKTNKERGAIEESKDVGTDAKKMIKER